MKRFPSKPRPEDWEWPPDIFWISPEGAVIPVIGHLTAIQAQPDTFDLAAAPRTRAEIDAAFRELLGRGWVRGRWSDGRFFFQMDRPRGVPLGNAFALALKFPAHTREVAVEFVDPRFERMSEEMSGQNFLEKKFPLAWGLNPRRRR